MSMVAHAERAAQGPGAGGSLENIANNSATAGQRPIPSDYRAVRWEARGLLWRESNLKRIRGCGRYAITSDGSVQVRANGQAVGYAGLASCGSIWADPVCNAKIQAVRRIEVGTLLARALETGSAAFGAYTIRHHQGQDLGLLWDGVNKCWAAVGRDGSVKRLRASMGWLGYVRAAEVTFGGNGPHPHLHPLHLFAGRVTEDDVAALHAVEFRAWQAAALRLGFDAPVEDAQHLHVVVGDAGEPMGDYFTKASYTGVRVESVGWEMTSTQTKSRTRASGSRTPWDVLAGVAAGDADDLDLWHSWEAGSKGKRALTWSRGLRDRFGLGVEASDEDVAAVEVGTAADAGFVIVDWSPIRACPVLGAQLLGVIGSGQRWAEGRQFCRDNGVEIREA
jgi:hypothetical protein